MFKSISYINLCILLAVSICQVALAFIYDDECPASPAFAMVLSITGTAGILLCVLALAIHRFDAYDGSNPWNILVTSILLIYLIGSRIATSIMGFRLASQSHSESSCASVFHWTSTLLIIVSYLIIVITCCTLIKLILLQRRYNRYHQSADDQTSTTKF